MRALCDAYHKEYESLACSRLSASGGRAWNRLMNIISVQSWTYLQRATTAPATTRQLIYNCYTN